MGLKYFVNRWLERGLRWKVLFFTLLNLVVLLVCIVIYLSLSTSEPGQRTVWQAIRLFLDSNSIIDQPSHYTWNNLLLLITECLGTILFSGLIVSLITNDLDQKMSKIKAGRIHYRLKEHVVIIGYDAIVPSVISELIKLPDQQYTKSKFVLQTSKPVEEIRNDLLSKLSERVVNKQVILVHAPRLSFEELELLCTDNAREIFIVGERNQSEHDAENMHTFQRLVEIHEKKGVSESKPLTIWFENEASYAALQLNDISEDWKKYFEFKPYNFYKRWANRLLTNSVYGEETQRIDYPELDHEGIVESSSKHVHLIIVGMNRMGIALAKEAAHLMHFPNFNEETGKNRTRITFIDDHADREMNFFVGRYSGYFEVATSKLYKDMSYRTDEDFPRNEDIKNHFLDIQFEFIKGRVESEHVRSWIKKQLEDDDAITTIAICLHDPSQSFGMAMYLPDEVYTRGRNDLSKPWEVVDKDKVVNIFVRQEKTGSLIKSFGDTAKSAYACNKKYANIYPFGMIDDSFAVDYDSNRLAMAFNFIYADKLRADISLNELSEKWKPLKISHKWSNLYLADSIEFKLRSIGLDVESAKQAKLTKEQIDTMAYIEHCRWNMEKLLLGYRPYRNEVPLGDEHVANLKNHMFVHPLIKPYHDLTDAEKHMDRNIIEQLPAILRMLKIEKR